MSAYPALPTLSHQATERANPAHLDLSLRLAEQPSVTTASVALPASALRAFAQAVQQDHFPQTEVPAKLALPTAFRLPTRALAPLALMDTSPTAASRVLHALPVLSQ